MIEVFLILIIAGTGCLLICQSPVEAVPVSWQGERKKMTKELKGTWSGLLLDVEGQRARLQMRLDQPGDQLRGEIGVGLIGEEEIEESKGQVTGRIGDQGEISFTFDLKGPYGPVTVNFVGKHVTLERHARATIYGTYQAPENSSRTLAAGVLILWRYDKK